MSKFNNLHPSGLARSLRFEARPTYLQSCSVGRAKGRGSSRLARDTFPRNSALLLGLVITSLWRPFPHVFRMERVGIMDSDRPRLEVVSKHNRVGYALPVVAMAIFPKQEAAAC